MADYPQSMKDAYSAWARQLAVVQALSAANVPSDPADAAVQAADYRMAQDQLNRLYDAANKELEAYNASRSSGGAHG